MHSDTQERQHGEGKRAGFFDNAHWGYRISRSIDRAVLIGP
jgi:hypothetical protein